jgi:hypothetical protein
MTDCKELYKELNSSLSRLYLATVDIRESNMGIIPRFQRSRDAKEKAREALDDFISKLKNIDKNSCVNNLSARRSLNNDIEIASNYIDISSYTKSERYLTESIENFIPSMRSNIRFMEM